MEIRLEKASASECKAKPDAAALGFGRHMADHMFVMTWDQEQGWHNAAVTKYADFALDPAAMVLHYGQAIFEGLKAFRGRDGEIHLFRPTANFERMNRSAERMCMPTIPVDQVMKGLRMLIETDADWVPNVQGASLYIRPTMIATEPALGVRPSNRYLFFIITCPVGAYYPEGFDPVKIYVTDKYVRAVPGGVGAAKTAGNYAASIMAAMEAQKAGYTQVLWLDAVERRYVEEVGTMNIFFVIGDQVITPPLTGSILPGITRQSVIQLLEDWGVEVVERKIAIEEVFAAAESGALKEIFGTGTAAVISPVGALHFNDRDCQVNGGDTGPMAQRLFEQLQGIQYGSLADPHHWVETL